jgi:hypothetical protein
MGKNEELFVENSLCGTGRFGVNFVSLTGVATDTVM